MTDNLKTNFFDWTEYAFKNKKEIKRLKAIFIAAPREISSKRFIQLVKEYLPRANILLGIANEDFIDGFEDQLQFKTLKLETVATVIQKVNNSNSKNRVYVLKYFQRELPHILEKLNFQKAVFINGSWNRMFHIRPEFYVLVKNKIEYELVSPFVDEVEARNYVGTIPSGFATSPFVKGGVSRSDEGVIPDQEIMQILKEYAALSFATDFQTSCALVKNGKLIIATYNTIVPFETYAWHYGSSKEKVFDPPNDLNHYDTVHAEVNAVIKAGENKIDLENCSLYVNLMPCPTCARMLCNTKIKEIVYQFDHSEGYAIKMLEKAGKEVRRVV